MKNITVSVSNETYRRARIWAAERETSVSAIVAYLLETLPGIRRAVQRFPAPGQPPASSVPSAAPSAPAVPNRL